MTDKLTATLAEAKRRYDAMTPEEKAAMHQAQRESWVRSFAPCEHGVRDWETCPECLANFAKARP